MAETLGVPREELTEELVAKNLRFLDAGNRQLRDLTGLEVAENLEVLVLRQNLIEDISFGQFTQFGSIGSLRTTKLTIFPLWNPSLLNG